MEKLFKPIKLGKYVREPYPSNLIIDIHSYCNAKCKVCPYHDLSKKLPMGYMEDPVFRRIIDEFAAVKKDYTIRGRVIFCNMGEPFLDPNVFEKISYVLDSGLDFVLQTNASLLTPNRVNKLNSIGFRGPIYISVHGITPSIYENIMGLNIERTLKNIDYLIDNYPKKLIRIRAITHGWPFGEVIKVKRYWKARGVVAKVFIPNSRTSLVSGISDWKFKYPGNKLKGCKKTLPLRDVVVTFDGDAVLCCEDMGRRAVLGNLKENSLLEVWNSAQALEVLEKVFLGKPSEADFPCKSCVFGLSTFPRLMAMRLEKEWCTLVNCHF